VGTSNPRSLFFGGLCDFWHEVRRDVDDPPQKPQKKDLPQSATWQRYAGMGVEFAAALCGLTLVGYWVDRHYGTGNKGTLIGAGIGLLGGGYNFIREAMALSKATIESSRPGDHERKKRSFQRDEDESPTD